MKTRYNDGILEYGEMISSMDDGSPIGFLWLIAVLILGGAYFAAAETALASINRIRVMSLADNGDRRAQRMLYLLDHFEEAETAILIGNNIMHIACATVATVFSLRTWGFSAAAPSALCLALLLFFLADLLPKRFARAASERFALAVAGSLYILMRLLAPLARLAAALPRAVFRRRARMRAPAVTEDELYDIIETLPAESEIDEETRELMQNALDFSGTLARDILTPWDRVVRLSLTMSDAEVMETVQQNAHSRLPVVDVHGEVIGMLQIRKYLKARLRERVPLAKVMDEPRFVSGDAPIDDLLPQMSALRTQIAVVRDGAGGGGPLGIVSVEDILEELVGEIHDEDDEAEAELCAN
ncbi:MAG: CNNM domain-containing protein [Clostridia bacterium]|nr:CNNM domain-containing protein [Clostridia bacterium]